MHYNQLKTAIDTQLSSKTVTPEMRDAMVTYVEHEGHNPSAQNRRPRVRPRWVVAVAVCLTLLVTSVPVLAFTTGLFDNLLAFYQEGAEPYLEPLDPPVSAEYDGVTVEILAAMADEYNVILKMKITDVKGRLKEEVWPDFTIAHPEGYRNYVMAEQTPFECTLYCLRFGGAELLDDLLTMEVQYLLSFPDPDSQDGYGYIGLQEYHNGSMPWTLTFPVQEAETRHAGPITVDEDTFFDISVSSFGGLHMRANSPRELYTHMYDTVTIEMRNGRTYTIDGLGTSETSYMHAWYTSDESAPLHVGGYFGRMLDVHDIQSISINGQKAPWLD